jgi:parallel beta-helix repeat protein
MLNKLSRERLVLGIIILFVGAGVMPSMGGTIVERHGSQSNKTSVMDFTTSGNILYVGGSGPNNYTKIQDAINDSSNGNTVFVYDYSSPYDENVIVGKSISLIGEDKHTTVIDGSNSGHVVSVSADWVNISGFTIQNSGDKWDNAGIDIRSNHNTITGNIISNNRDGIYLRFFSSNNVITGNTISSNNRDGIYLCYSSNNTISGNSFFNNGLWVDGAYQNTVVNNMVNGKPLVYLEDESDYIISDAGQVILVNCDNIIAENLDLSDTTVGIELWRTDNSKIRNNDCSNNLYGIYLGFSSSNIITGNIISNNEDDGIELGDSCSNTITGNNIISNNDEGMRLMYSCNNNTITGNIISNNERGIIFWDSSNNTINGNDIISNNRNGICLRFFSSDNVITGNTISSNKEDGIRLRHSIDNVITGNTISSNNRDGIRLWDSSDNNTIAGNIIISNLDAIHLYDSSSNTIICNNIILNDFGISLSQSSNNTILKNNFLNNKLQAFFNNCTNTWKQNYWNRPRILPKLIFGVKQTPPPWIPCLPDIDWRPALKPYDITTTQECNIDDLLRVIDNPFLERFSLLNLLLQILRI